MKRRVFLGLGSNLGDRVANLQQAVDLLSDVTSVSAVYETDPLGGPPQAPFLNIVVELRTSMTARRVLGLAQRLEQLAHRVRREHWGPRTLDVDVLWIDGETVTEPNLVVPHPRWAERAFVVEPLRELAPDVVSSHEVSAAAGRVRVVGPLAELAAEFDGPLVLDPSVPGPLVRVVGAGRAGSSLAAALSRRGWTVELWGRGEPWRHAGVDALAVLLCVPDSAVAEVARELAPSDATVLHVAGSLGLSVLAPHSRVGSLHPLVSLPSAEVGMPRLLGGAFFAVAGDDLAAEMAASLGGTAVHVDDDRRAMYHAAACVAANHLVGLLGQVERLATCAGVPAAAYMALAAPLVDGVAASSAAAMLTGPVARADWPTVSHHLEVLHASAPTEVAGYLAGARLAAQLAEVGWPDELL